MAVVDGQRANAQTFNDAFLCKTQDNTVTGIVDLNHPGSAPQVANVQTAINDNITDIATNAADISTLQSTKEDKSDKGVANGYAPLNASVLIDALYLPSYVDDVLEFANFGALPVTGETGKIYVTIDDNKTFRWTGSVYVEVGPSSQPNNQVIIEGGSWSFSETPAGNQIVSDYNDPFNSDQSRNSTSWFGVLFTNTVAGDSVSARFDLRRLAGAAGAMVVEIYSVSGGLPNSLLATSDSVDASTLGTTGSPHTQVVFNFSSPLAMVLTDYIFVLNLSSVTGTVRMATVSPGTDVDSSVVETSNSGASWTTPTIDVLHEFNVLGPASAGLTWSADAYVQQEGFADDRNTLLAQTVNFGATEDIAYVTVNKDTDATTNLTVSTGTLASFAPDEDDLIIARLVDGGAEIGRKLHIKDGESAGIEDGIHPVTVVGTGISNIVTATGGTTYVVLATDDIVLLDNTAGTISVSLPTAAGIAGKIYTFKKISNDFSFSVLQPAGAETINGLATDRVSTICEVVKIVSDGTNWQILDRKTDTDWIAYTDPVNGGGASAGGGSITIEAFWKRQGDSIDIQISAQQTVTSTSVTAVAFAIPSGLTIDSTKVAQVATTCGLVSASTFGTTSSPGFNAFVGYWNVGSNQIQFVENGTGSVLAGNDMTANDEIGAKATAPILNWRS